MSALSQRFSRLLPGVDTQPLWDEVVRNYGGSGRDYHTLEHVAFMLEMLDRSGSWTRSLELAIWYHDVIYDPVGSGNELLSWKLFQRRLGPLLTDDIVDDVERLILATDFRRQRSGVADEALLEDIDLGILGSDPGDYDFYSNQIRREYAVYSDEDYARGRAAVLEHFLTTQIYQTPEFARWEEMARANMKHELAEMKSRGGI